MTEYPRRGVILGHENWANVATPSIEPSLRNFGRVGGRGGKHLNHLSVHQERQKGEGEGRRGLEQVCICRITEDMVMVKGQEEMLHRRCMVYTAHKTHT